MFINHKIFFSMISYNHVFILSYGHKIRNYQTLQGFYNKLNFQINYIFAV